MVKVNKKDDECEKYNYRTCLECVLCVVWLAGILLQRVYFNCFFSWERERDSGLCLSFNFETLFFFVIHIYFIRMSDIVCLVVSVSFFSALPHGAVVFGQVHQNSKHENFLHSQKLNDSIFFFFCRLHKDGPVKQPVHRHTEINFTDHWVS